MDIRVLVPVAQGSEELEAITIIDLLRRAAISVTVAGEHEIVTCARGTKIIPDKRIHSIDKSDVFDCIVLPGGSVGTSKLMQNEYVIYLLSTHIKAGKLIGAVCAAPTILSVNKLIPLETTLTSNPSVKNQLTSYNYIEEDVVVCGNIVTSRGAGTSIDFTLKIIEILAGKAIAQKVATAIVYNNYGL